MGLDTAKINSCVHAEGMSLMKDNADKSEKAGATGSPTLLINGSKTKAVYQYGNSEAYKQAVCGAFDESPAECGQELGSSTSTTEGGSCN